MSRVSDLARAPRAASLGCGSTAMAAFGSADSWATASRTACAAFLNAANVAFRRGDDRKRLARDGVALLPPVMETSRRLRGATAESVRISVLMALPRFS